jgi:predicted nucleotidyltransferase component of viral defense system
LLRAVSRGTSVNGPDGSPAIVQVVFKGGTSLSRVYHLTNRFSEDVDLLVLFPDASGAGTKDRALKQVAAAAQEHLGLPDDRCVLETSTKGVKRNVEFH